MKKPNKNKQIKFGDIVLQHYTNGSFGYFSEVLGKFINIPHELGEKLLTKKDNILSILREYFPDAASINPEKLFEVTHKIINANENSDKLKSYLVVHTHKHGTDHTHFRSNNDHTGWYNEENVTDDIMNVCKSLGIEFEPDRNEFLDIVELDIENSKTI